MKEEVKGKGRGGRGGGEKEVSPDNYMDEWVEWMNRWVDGCTHPLIMYLSMMGT